MLPGLRTVRLWGASSRVQLSRHLPIAQFQQLRCRRGYKYWTTEERAKAWNLQSQGHSLVDIAAALERTTKSVESQLYSLRVDPPEGKEIRKPWSLTECERVVELWNQGVPSVQIAHALGRTVRTVYSRIRSLKRGPVLTPGANKSRRSVIMTKQSLRLQVQSHYREPLEPPRLWDTSEDETLRRLRESSTPRMTFREIGEQMGRSPASVSRRYAKISQDQPASAVRFPGWTTEDVAIAVEMASSGISTREIGAVLGRTRLAVSKRLRSRARTPAWTKADEECLISMKSACAPWDEIASKLSRSCGAVELHYSRMPITRRDAARSTTEP